MRLLFLGDVVGSTGRAAVVEHVPRLRARYKLDFVIVNGENAAGGFGISEKIAARFFEAGVDVITTGNHIWNQREIMGYIAREDRLLRPANYPAGTPGGGAGLFRAADGSQILVVNLLGRVFMADMDCPFQAIARELEACPMGAGADVVFVDMHAETTSEKQAMGHYLDGKVSAVIGTHTHVPTADDRILPGGTAYLTDAGMCGVFDSVIGMEKDEPVNRFVTRMNSGRFAPRTSDEGGICGVAVDINVGTGLATAISPLRLGADIRNMEPDFWGPVL